MRTVCVDPALDNGLQRRARFGYESEWLLKTYAITDLPRSEPSDPSNSAGADARRTTQCGVTLHNQLDDDAFYVQIAAALASCQMVELELKLYIADAFALAAKSIQGKMPFKFSGDDYIDSPLERLIEGFKKLSDNDELVKRLSAFKKERNFLTHRGMSHCIDYDGELSVSDAALYRERLKTLQEEASMLRSAIHFEGNGFRGHLYFDDIDDRAT